MVSLISRERDRKLRGGIKNITDITAPLTVREEYLGATLLLCKLVFGHRKTSVYLPCQVQTTGKAERNLEFEGSHL